MKPDPIDTAFNEFIAWLYGPGAISEKQSTEMRKAFISGVAVCYKFFQVELPKQDAQTIVENLQRISEYLYRFTEVMERDRKHTV